ncbi:MAG: transglutaminaseTgpA domain-containing protein [Phycisphaerales bacterium]|nr:transglutaminaseTgpA domain-containing protein [Phycisphaerales bacterium]
MSPLRHYRRHLRIEVLLAIAAYAVAVETAGLLVVLGIAAIASGYVTDGPRGRSLPRWVATLLAIAGVAWSGIDWIDNPDPGRTMALVGRLTLWLAVVKLYENRTPRDDRQVIMLCVVAVIVGCLYSFQLLFGLLVMIFAGQTVLTAMLHRLHASLCQMQSSRREVEAVGPVPPVDTTTGRHPRGQFRTLAISSAFIAMVVATLIFVIFPRDAVGKRAIQGSRTGFTPEVDLIDNDRIVESHREVFTVTWKDPAGVAQKWPQPLLLRGAVLSKYDPLLRRWVVNPNRWGRRTLTTNEPDQFVGLEAAAAPEFQRGTWEQIVTMRSLATEAVFSSWAPVAIACDQPRSFTLDPRTLVLQDTSPDRLDRYWTYRLLIQPFPSTETLASIVGDTNSPQRRVSFPVPEIRQETLRILSERAPELLADVPPGDAEAKWRRNREIADALTAYLQGGDFRYSLDLRDFIQESGEDPITLFLTRYKFGHCEFFASALAAMCRSVGVEARVVSGYVAVEYDDSLEHYIVRESNAHAWVEVRTGRWQWRQFDPTTQETLEALQAGRRSWADDWRWLYDRADFLWNSRFVTFDGATQATIADRFGSELGASVRKGIDWAGMRARQVNRFFLLGPAGYIWLGIVGLVIVVGVIAIVTTIRRRSRLRRVLGLGRSTGSRGFFGAAFYSDILDAFSLIGSPKPDSVAPMAHLASIRTVRPDLAEAAEPLIRLFYEVRFGNRVLDRRERQEVELAAKAFLEAAAVPAGELS